MFQGLIEAGRLGSRYGLVMTDSQWKGGPRTFKIQNFIHVVAADVFYYNNNYYYYPTTTAIALATTTTIALLLLLQ